MDIVGAIAVAVLLWLGRDLIRTHVFPPGIFLMSIFAVFTLYEPVRKFALFYNNFQQALGASSGIFAVMDAQDEVKEKRGAPPLPSFHDNVRLDGVTFCYEDDATRCILQGVDLEVRRGEIVAIVGSSGAGKTTLVHLIPRFFDVTGGRILIDGHDVRDVTLSSLRAQ